MLLLWRGRRQSSLALLLRANVSWFISLTLWQSQSLILQLLLYLYLPPLLSLFVSHKAFTGRAPKTAQCKRIGQNVIFYFFIFSIFGWERVSLRRMGRASCYYLYLRLFIYIEVMRLILWGALVSSKSQLFIDIYLIVILIGLFTPCRITLYPP